MADVPTPEQVEAIRERLRLTVLGYADYPLPEDLTDRLTLLAAYDAVTAEVQRLRDALAPDGSLERLANTYTAEGTVIVLRRMGRLRDERDEAKARAAAAERKVAAVRAEVERWEADELEHLATFGQHHPASLGRVAEIVRAVLDGEDEEPAEFAAPLTAGATFGAGVDKESRPCDSTAQEGK